MMNIKISLISFALLISCISSFGHAETIRRTWCLPGLRSKFVAIAEGTSYARDVYFGSGPAYTVVYPYTICSERSGGCSRPQVAECSSSGIVYDYYRSGGLIFALIPQHYTLYAKADYTTGGAIITERATGRATAALYDTLYVDSARVSQLDTTGGSFGEVKGDFEIVQGRLTGTNITGALKIGAGSDFYTKLKVIVVKENMNASTSEIERLEELYKRGIFENVVSSSMIEVTKSGIKKTGIFSELTSSQLAVTSTNEEYGVSLNNITISTPMNVNLGPNEALTVITLVDGALDYSSAIIPNPNLPSAELISKVIPGTENVGIVYPNPASTALNFRISAKQAGQSLLINAYDLTGRLLRNIYSGVTIKGNNSIQNIDISDLPKGIISIEIKIDEIVKYEKLSIK